MMRGESVIGAEFYRGLGLGRNSSRSWGCSRSVGCFDYPYSMSWSTVTATRRFPSIRRVAVFLCLQVYHGTMAARPRRKRVVFLAATAVMFSLWMQPACRPTPHVAVEQAPVDSTMSGFPVPQQVRRLAVWYPRTWDQDVAYGYSRLEQAAFQLKTQRSWIKIVERRNIEPLTDEQRLQVSGRVADDGAMRVGKLLGADSMLFFRIDVPSWRDRLLARFYGKMPPLVVSSKIISVESGEVLYDDIVTAMPAPLSGEWSDYVSDYALQPALRFALDHALLVAIAHLNQSFR